jgi:hypothetical protein
LPWNVGLATTGTSQVQFILADKNADAIHLLNLAEHRLKVSSSACVMEGLERVLRELSMLIYFETFIAGGFTTWESLMEITESEMTKMYIRLGDRRVR